MANESAWQEGWQLGSQRGQERRAHKQALSDAEFQEKHNEIQGMVDNLQTRLSTLDPSSTEYLQTRDQLAQALQTRDEHWGSQTHPNALMRFGKMLGKDLRFPKKPASAPAPPPIYGQSTIDANGEKIPAGPAYEIREQGSQTPEQVKAQAEATQLASAGPPSPTEQGEATAQTEITRTNAVNQATIEWLKKNNAPQEVIDQAVASLAKVPLTKGVKAIGQPYKDSNDGKFYQRFLNPDGTDFREEVPGYTQPAGKASHSKFAETEAAYRHDYNIPEGEPLTVADILFINQQTALSSAAPSESITTTLKQDLNGWYVPVTETNRRVPGFGVILKPPRGPLPGEDENAQPGEGQPTHLGGVKKKAQAAGSPTASSGATHVGKAVLRGRTPEYTAAYKDYETAKGLSKIADLVAQHPDDAINQKRLAVALEKVSAGRFTTQALDYIITSGWGNTIQQWVNNPTHGALPADILRQLIDGAHENETAKKQVLDDINTSESEPEGSTPPSSTNPDLDAIMRTLQNGPSQTAPAHPPQ